MDERFMRERPVLPLLTSMALPMVISMLVNSLYNIVDSFFVAKISEDAMTALSLVYPIQNLIGAVAIGFGVGMNAVIAYHLGAKEDQKANIAAAHGLLLSAAHGLLLTAVCIVGTPAFLRMFTSSEQVIALGTRYSTVAFSFSLVIALGLAFEKIFQAVGRMKLTMVSLLCGCVTNILLDPVLIFGLGPFPELGITGAALATGIGQTVSLLIYIAVYLLQPVRVRLGRRYLVRSGRMDRKLYAIGIPAILNLALPSLLISALNVILAGYSQIYVVVLGVYYKLQTFLYLPANGIIQGMRPLVSYNYGAGEHRRVRQIYSAALCMNASIMALGTVICLLVPDQLIGLFTTNPETVAAGGTALRIICAGFLFSAVSVTSSGALEGLGKGAPSLVISLFRYLLLIVPAAAALSRFMGPSGVWWAFPVAELFTAGAAFLIYRRSAAAPQ